MSYSCLHPFWHLYSRCSNASICFTIFKLLWFPNSVYSQRKRTRAAVKKKGDSNNSSTITDSHALAPYFSPDIWFEILSWLSSTWLYSIMSSVCKTWYTMIREPYFVETNLHRSKFGHIIIRNKHGMLWRVELYSSYLEARRLKIDFRGVMHSTSQGLCIFDDCGAYYVINPVTMQRAEISRFDRLIPQCDSFSYSAVRDRRSGEVKLVLACVKWNQIYSWYVQKLEIENSWKMISEGHRFGPMDFPGISIAGFLIYVVRDNIVVLDVSVETIHKICCPAKVCPVTYLQMGTDVLSCISHDSGRLFIHVLEDFLAGNWSLYKILDYGYILGVSPEFHHFLGWISNSKKFSSNGEELFVCLCKSTSTTTSARSRGWSSFLSGNEKWAYFTYNLKTKRISSLHGFGPYYKIGDSDRVWFHTHSLLSWKTL